MTGVRLWVGAAATDAGIRLAVQLVSTIIIGRTLTASDFGLATMVLTIVATLGVFIGLPFEESLSQRRRLHRAHLESALFVSLLLAGIATVAALILGPVVERAAGVSGLTAPLVVASLFLSAQGPAAIARAVCRRERAFVDLAACQAVSTTLACTLGVLSALLGAGVYALIIQRLFPILAVPVMIVGIRMARGLRVRLAPRWHRDRFAQIGRFASFHLLDLCLSTVAPMVLAFLVNGLLGTARLGQYNIALRMVEPLRAGIFGIYHNLAFSVLAGKAASPSRLVAENGRIAAAMATLIVPLFAGLSATAPLVIPILIGPDWNASVTLAQILCAGTAVALPLELFYTGFSALGRPHYGVWGALAGFVTMIAGFSAAAILDRDVAAAVAFASYEMAIAAVGLCLALHLAGGDVVPALRRMARIAGAAMVMVAFISIALQAGWPAGAAPVRLLAAVVIGIVTYAGALMILCPDCLRDLRTFVVRGRTGDRPA